MEGTILITGAIGNVGRELVQLLHDAGQPVRAAIVSAAEATNLPDGVAWALWFFHAESSHHSPRRHQRP